MAISAQYGFALQVELTRTADPTTRNPGLGGTGRLATEDWRRCPGLFGTRPAVTLQGPHVHFTSDPSERPRWWMSRTRRLASATARTGAMKVGEALLKEARAGDRLGLGRWLDGRLNLSLHRAERCVLLCGNLAPSDDAPVEEPLETHVLDDGKLLAHTHRRGALIIGWVGPPGPRSQPTAFSPGSAPDVIDFALDPAQGMPLTTALACAVALHHPHLETDPW